MVDTAAAGLLEPTCAALITAGFKHLHALCSRPRSPARWSHRLQSFRALDASGQDRNILFGKVMSHARQLGAPLLLPVGTEDVHLLAGRQGELPPGVACVPIPAAAQMDDLCDKLLFNRLMTALGYATPRTVAVTSALTVREVAPLGFPVVAKPNVGHGGAGCRLLENKAELEVFLRSALQLPPYHLQEFIAGEDVPLTMLCEDGEVFAIATRRCWLHFPGKDLFEPARDLEFIECAWLEELGRALVARLGFSGVADFDLRVDFAARRAVFLECDPRMMGSQRACQTFGLNPAALLCRRALGERFPCARARRGRFLSLRSLPTWLKQRGWRGADAGSPLQTGLHLALVDPFPLLARRLRLG